MAFSKESFEGLLIDGVKLTENVLGKGAYGKVVEVVWNGTVCAAKQVHEIFIEEVSPAERAKVVKDFEREFRTWAKLRHPNIVILLGVFFIKDSPRIVLEKMDTSLRLYLEKHTKADFPLVHKIDVLKQVAQGLCYLHNQNPPLVHHDLSPNNILLNEISFATKLTDFGMTRAISPSALTRMSSIKGTLPFMAPESLRSQPRYDDKLDTFSYGNIIISTVTHKWPIPCDPNRYEGEKLVALTEYERREEYLKIFNDDENRVLAPTVKRCLENRPERRPTSLTLVDEINAASINFQQAKTWSQQVLDLKNERQQFVAQAASCQESIKALQERNVAEEEEKIALQTANAHLLEEKRAMQGTNTRLVEEKTALQGANTRLVEEKKALEGTITHLEEEKKVLQGESTDLAERVRSLQGLNKRLVEEKSTLQTLCTHLQGANTCLQKDKKALQICCAHFQDASTQLQEEMRNFQESYLKVNLEIAQLQLAAAALHPGVKTQLEELGPLLDTRLQESDLWYLVDVRWMKQWKKYVGFDSWDRTQVGDYSANPGPVGNSNLLLGQDDDTLKEHVMMDREFSLIPEVAWNKLTTWYGIAEGSRPIARKAEIYLIRLELGVDPLQEGEMTITRNFSRADRMSTVKEVIVKEFNLPTNKDTRLLHRYMTDSYKLVKDDAVLQESGVCTGQLMLLEVKKDDGKWPSALRNVKTQLEKLRPLLDARLQENNTWYLVDVRWMMQWKKYVGFDSWDRTQVGVDSANPGPLDNSNLLLGQDDILKDHLMEDLDYSLIPETAWNKLTTWYGIAEGSRPIARKAIEWGMYVKHLKVEVYPIRLELGVHPLKGEKTITRTFSRVDKMSAIKEVIVKEFDLPANKDTRLWHRYMTNSYEHVKDDDMLQESGIYTGQLMFLEVKKDDGTWPRDTYTQGSMNTTRSFDTAGATGGSSYYTRSSSGGGSSGSLFGSYGRGSADPGLCGLQNLGNTSFMNSALQCLSNTEQLTDYFLSKSYLKHINKKNPLGMGGQLADAFGGLLSEIWTDKISCTAPRGLKSVIGRHASQFTGNAQHDSQELLAFLLDGLHEDLNQILNKPYVDMSIENEAERTDDDIARETWEKSLMRNRSVIVNLFQGQLKSTHVCLDCKSVSRVFNPFMYLSLPLPIETTRWLTVHLVRLDPAVVIEKYKLRLPKQGRIGHLQEELGKLSGVDHTKMVTIDVYQHRFHRIYERKDGLNHILDRDDIFVYEVPIISANDPDWVVVPVYHREQYTKTYNYSYSGGSYTQSYTRLFGLPLLVTVSRQNTTYQGLHDAIMSQCSRYVKRPPEVKGMENDGEPRMFEILAVNGYGSQTVVRFKDDDKPLKLGGNVYIGCDWDESWRDKCYDEDKSLETVDHASMEAPVKPQKKRISINDCIELFTSANELRDDDLWYCPHCKDRRQATKKFDLWKLPEILVVHLKRFSHDKEKRTKNDELIDFPLEIDLSNFVVNKDHPSSMYELYAVTNHHGGMGGGHYTAFAMNYEYGKWYNFDDSHVSETDSSHVVTSAAYILFFRRKDTKSLKKSLSMDQSGETSRKHREDEPDKAEVYDFDFV